MAQGDLTIFDEAKLALLDGTHDLDTDTIRVGFVDGTTTPTAGLATPAWGDFTQESGGNFPGTPDAMTVSLTESGGTVTLDFTTNISYASNASNPTDVRWAIIYNDSATGDPAIGFVEIDTSGFDATSGLTSLTWGANVFTMS